MEERKVDELIETFDRYVQSIDNNQEASISFLKEAGILNENGELEKPYQECIHPEQTYETTCLETI